MRKALGVSIFVLGSLLSSVSAQASGKTSFTTAIGGSTIKGVVAGSTVTVTLCSINTSVDATCPSPGLLSFTCPVITLKDGPQTIKASCSTQFKPTAFTADVVVIGVAPTACSASGLIGGTTSCGGVALKLGK